MEKLDISVLFVEDEELLRAIYERILEKVVARLYTAENGKEGLELYKKHQPDLIVTDIMMPVMDGLEMVEKIRKEDNNIRLVILSAYGEAEYFMDAIKIGVNSFLLKPVETKKLISLVEELAKSILLEREVSEQELKRRMAEENLRRLNEELERRIEERTVDLQKEIKERIQAENELKELNLDLENRVNNELRKRQDQQRLLIQKSKLESMGELAAGIAHEINQPLGGLSMGLDNILFKLSMEKITEEYLSNKINDLFKDIDRIRQIINHVRVFSRDQQAVLTEVVDVNQVIHDALSLMKAQYTSHQIEIVLNLTKDICQTEGNKYRLEQVALNLLSNAKYAVDAKQVATHEKDYKKRITINSRSTEDNVEFEIEDNGIGIPEDNIDNIFDMFFTTKDIENGTGLGLSISYGIVKEMKGQIFVESTEGEFARVRVVLPKK